MAKYRKDNKNVKAFRIGADSPPLWFKFTDICTYCSDSLDDDAYDGDYIYVIKINDKTLYAEQHSYIVKDGETFSVFSESEFEKEYEYCGKDYEVGDMLDDGRVIDKIWTVGISKYPYAGTYGHVDGKWVRLS